MTDRESLLDHCETLIQLGQLDTAIALLEPVVADAIPCARAYLLLGEACFGKGQPQNALAHFESARALDPHFPSIYNDLCITCLALNRAEEAARMAERAVELDPHYSDGFFNLGLACQMLGRLEDAAQHFQRAAELEPDSYECAEQLGLTYRALARYAEAKLAFLRCVEINPNHAAAHYAMGLTCVDLRDWNTAALSFRRAIEIDPDNLEYLEMLAAALLNLRRWVELGAVYRQIRERSPQKDPEPDANLLLLKLRNVPFSRDFTAQDFFQWLPVDIKFDASDSFLIWQYAGDSSLDDRFGRYTTPRLDLLYPDHPKLETDLRVLEAFAESQDSLRPNGIIFHLGRCGSTVIANALRAVRGAISVSEPIVLNELLWPCPQARPPYAQAEWEAARKRLIRGCVAAYGQKRCGDERKFFLKLPSWPVLYMDFVKSLWPDVPCLFVYRDPLEAMASHLATSMVWIDTRRPSADDIGIRPQDVETVSHEEYIACLLGRFCRVAAQCVDENTRLVNYNEISLEGMATLFRFFGVEEVEVDRAALQRAMSTNAKDPERKRTFVPDSESKRQSVQGYARAMVEKHIEAPYAELERLRARYGRARTY